MLCAVCTGTKIREDDTFSAQNLIVSKKISLEPSPASSEVEKREADLLLKTAKIAVRSIKSIN